MILLQRVRVFLTIFLTPFLCRISTDYETALVTGLSISKRRRITLTRTTFNEGKEDLTPTTNAGCSSSHISFSNTDSGASGNQSSTEISPLLQRGVGNQSLIQQQKILESSGEEERAAQVEGRDIMIENKRTVPTNPESEEEQLQSKESTAASTSNDPTTTIDTTTQSAKYDHPISSTATEDTNTATNTSSTYSRISSSIKPTLNYLIDGLGSCCKEICCPDSTTESGRMRLRHCPYTHYAYYGQSSDSTSESAAATTTHASPFFLPEDPKNFLTGSVEDDAAFEDALKELEDKLTGLCFGCRF